MEHIAMIIDVLHNWSTAEGRQYFNTRWNQTDKLAFNYFWTYYKEHVARVNDGKDEKAKLKEAPLAYLKSEFDRFTGGILPKKALAEKCKELAYHGDQSLAPVVEAITGRIDQLDCKALQHWLWQCKRKMFGRSVVNHLFIMLYEPWGGSGKSTFLDKLLSPLADYTLRWNLGQIADERNILGLGDNFVVMLDEMAKPEKVSADELKHQITATHNNVRLMYSQTILWVPQRCSFIGASNKPLDTLIIDNSSMRRFWQLDCQEKMDWDFVNELDAVALWRSIDESREDGYVSKDILLQVKEAQQELVTPDIVEEFLRERKLAGELGTQIKIKNEDLYSYFRDYANDAGRVPMAKTTFCKHLRNKLAPWRTNKTKGVWINQDHLLNDYDKGPDIDDIIGRGNG